MPLSKNNYFANEVDLNSVKIGNFPLAADLTDSEQYCVVQVGSAYLYGKAEM